MSEKAMGASNAELAQPQEGNAIQEIPPVTREPILAFYTQKEVDTFMGKRLGEHRQATEAYRKLEPLLQELRSDYGCDTNQELIAVLQEAKTSGLRREGSVPTPSEWGELMRQNPKTDLRRVARDPRVVRALRAGFSLADAVKISEWLRLEAARPRENGASRCRGGIRLDVSQLSDAQMDEIARRVKRGEQVKF